MRADGYRNDLLRTALRATNYSRVSADDLRQRRSVGEQEEDNLELIEREGWTLAGSFVDNDRSASRFATKGRPGFAKLVQHIEAGGCDVLVLWESSRGSRTLTEWSHLLDLCRERGVLVHVVTHRRTYDLNLPRDWKTLAEEGVSNAYASEETRDRVKRAVRANATNGKPHGRVVYGYAREYDSRGRFVRQTVREDQASVIREVARRILAGKSTSSIVAWLNDRGEPTPAVESTLRRVEELRASDVEDDQRMADELAERAAGYRWDLTSLKKMITNPGYAGLRVHQGRVIGAAGWPEILTADEHRKVVAILGNPERKVVRDGSVRHLLTNVARCGECGSALTAQKVRGGRYAYLCGGKFCVSINALWLEPFVEMMLVGRDAAESDGGEAVVGFLETPRARRVFAPAVDRAAIARAEAEAEALQAELNEAIETVGRPGGLTVATLARLEQSLTARIEDARRRATPPAVPPVIGALTAPGVDVRAEWARLDIAQRRTVVRLLADVRVQRGRRGARTFDFWRLGKSRWMGDSVTWGEMWREAGVL